MANDEKETVVYFAPTGRGMDRCIARIPVISGTLLWQRFGRDVAVPDPDGFLPAQV